MTSAPGREAEAAGVIARAAGAGAEQLVPSRGTHGSSTLHPARNPRGHHEVWEAVEGFLQRTVP